jgi:hypothetical protein
MPIEFPAKFHSEPNFVIRRRQLVTATNVIQSWQFCEPAGKKLIKEAVLWIRIGSGFNPDAMRSLDPDPDGQKWPRKMLDVLF